MSVNYKEVFESWYGDFKSHSLFTTMTSTVEGSKWHREANVGVHTDMVVASYIDMCGDDVWGKVDFMGAIVCAMHDVGKPACEELVDAETGRKSYKGHEITSAMLWIDYMLSTDNMLQAYLSDMDVYNIGVVIQYHLPFKLSNDNLRVLKTHLGRFGLIEMFIRCSYADQYGRDSDDKETNLANALDWYTSNFIEDVVNSAFDKTKLERNVSGSFDTNINNERIFMIGVTGVGKSTYIRSLGINNIHSMDTLRLELYGNNEGDSFDVRQRCFFASCDDKDFTKHIQRDFNQKVKNGQVVIDNTSLTAKSRRRYYGKDNGAIVIIRSAKSNLKQLVSRGDVGLDKTLHRMYFHNFKLPIYGEFDNISINLHYDVPRSGH